MAGIDVPSDADEPAWRERAVTRSLNAARSRAELRVQRFLDAAFELIDERGSTEFTIQEVVERSKQSLRGFYEYFEGKDELVLALFEETVREAGDDIRAAVEAENDALGRLRIYAIRLHEWCDPGETPASAARTAAARSPSSRCTWPRTTPTGCERPWHRSRASWSSSSTPPPRPERSTSPTYAGRPHSSSRQ